MPRANRYFLPGSVWYITHRCHQRESLLQFGRDQSVNAIWIKAMEKAENTGPKFVVCISNSEYPASLELHKIYRVLPDEEAAQEGDIRISD